MLPLVVAATGIPPIAIMQIADFRNNSCELASSVALGRYVRASRDIRAGELLLCEQPVVVGPSWDSKLCCLNCYSESTTMCKACHIAPLCALCTSAHQPIECAWLAAAQLPPNLLLDHFDLITPLRCVMLATDAARALEFNAFWRLQSHCTERRDTGIWRLHRQQVVAPMLSRCAHLLTGDRCTEEFVQRCCGILDVNAMEVRTQRSQEIPVRGLYPMAALLPHDCANNTFITVDAAKVMRVYASVAIAAGETVYNNYTSSLLGTASRGEHLWLGKYFRCQCSRCLDPTELGTHFSSVGCTNCSTTTGLLTFDADAHIWTCIGCQATSCDQSVQQRLAAARLMADRVGDRADVAELEQLIARQSGLLNGNHYLVVESKQKLAALVRSMCDDDAGMERRQRCDALRLLELKVRLCEELLPVLRVLKPGISRMTAIALYEQFTAMARLADQKRAANAMSPAEYVQTLCRTEELAKECVAMLVYEPRSTPEGELALNGMQHLKRLRDLIAKQQKQLRAMIHQL